MHITDFTPADSTGVAPRDVLLVDDQISNVARALAGGFSALQVPPSRGLDATIWARALANATDDGHLLPPPRTHAYCPADGAVFADGDGSAYAKAAQDVVIQAPTCEAAKDTTAAPKTPERPARPCAEATPPNHHRFILRHGDFEAVRSMVAPTAVKPRHARSRSQDVSCFDDDEPVAPTTPAASRPPLRRVRSFSAAGWWATVRSVDGARKDGVWSTSTQCPALCAQMARLGMTAEA